MLPVASECFDNIPATSGRSCDDPSQAAPEKLDHGPGDGLVPQVLDQPRLQANPKSWSFQGLPASNPLGFLALVSELMRVLGFTLVLVDPALVDVLVLTLAFVVGHVLSEDLSEDLVEDLVDVEVLVDGHLLVDRILAGHVLVDRGLVDLVLAGHVLVDRGLVDLVLVGLVLVDLVLVLVLVLVDRGLVDHVLVGDLVLVDVFITLGFSLRLQQSSGAADPQAVLLKQTWVEDRKRYRILWAQHLQDVDNFLFGRLGITTSDVSPVRASQRPPLNAAKSLGIEIRHGHEFFRFTAGHGGNVLRCRLRETLPHGTIPAGTLFAPMILDPVQIFDVFLGLRESNSLLCVTYWIKTAHNGRASSFLRRLVIFLQFAQLNDTSVQALRSNFEGIDEFVCGLTLVLSWQNCNVAHDLLLGCVGQDFIGVVGFQGLEEGFDAGRLRGAGGFHCGLASGAVS
ncbi:uncharacterized protein J3D65DRAFT_685702 [Phyllosticta citribraziliensis]|uniref:Uncharacterized protein n=1 Tax=Phyllosticta citribraziliensis TaxID=989973 RepID=A0ABR1LF75_9PEZI